MLKPLVIWLALSEPLAATPLQYTLDADSSEVGFEVTMGHSPLKGMMPVTRADILLDFDKAAQSRVSVTLDPADARMGLPFATEAMKSPEVLATKRFPEIRFESTRFRARGDGATVDGQITIRGVTRPITLAARLFRPNGSAEGHRKDLTIRLTGRVSRADFGANGFPDLVGDEVRLDITAHIRLASDN
ncbi:YceI family protein [Frigidibacter sp. SD6-1]|uniref:YceI family protein n=1 Tax=Frigidibacter sp. SD6-1 TaxID=3032581 RepID=UPI0024DF31FC|nr:YceI family protein [Frigidibacter sp. SD6-1]